MKKKVIELAVTGAYQIDADYTGIVNSVPRFFKGKPSNSRGFTKETGWRSISTA
jgi:hypothetical protein